MRIFHNKQFVPSVSGNEQYTMSSEQERMTQNIRYLDQFQAQKEQQSLREDLARLPDELAAWMACYLQTHFQRW